jgi:hypothetical protein
MSPRLLVNENSSGSHAPAWEQVQTLQRRVDVPWVAA